MQEMQNRVWLFIVVDEHLDAEHRPVLMQNIKWSADAKGSNTFLLDHNGLAFIDNSATAGTVNQSAGGLHSFGQSATQGTS